MGPASEAQPANTRHPAKSTKRPGQLTTCCSPGAQGENSKGPELTHGGARRAWSVFISSLLLWILAGIRLSPAPGASIHPTQSLRCPDSGGRKSPLDDRLATEPLWEEEGLCVANYAGRGPGCERQARPLATAWRAGGWGRPREGSTGSPET